MFIALTELAETKWERYKIPRNTKIYILPYISVYVRYIFEAKLKLAM